MTIIIRVISLLIALQLITGTNKKTITRDAINIRAICVINKPENTNTFESLEISRQGLYFLVQIMTSGVRLGQQILTLEKALKKRIKISSTQASSCVMSLSVEEATLSNSLERVRYALSSRS